MFSQANQTKSTLLFGQTKFTKSFIFEAAIHWAEKGCRVIYITQAPLESLPATYHDRSNHSHNAFNLMRFMYLPTYENLIEQLVDLHTFAVLPTVLLIDDLHNYISDLPTKEQSLDIHIAKLCAFIYDSTNACSRILKNPVQLCVSVSTPSILDTCYSNYFDNVWYLTVNDTDSENNSQNHIELYRREEKTCEPRKIFRYRNFTDGTLVLKQITEKFVSNV